MNFDNFFQQKLAKGFRESDDDFDYERLVSLLLGRTGHTKSDKAVTGYFRGEQGMAWLRSAWLGFCGPLLSWARVG